MTDDISKVVREMREAVQDGEPMKFRYLSQWADRLESATTPAEVDGAALKARENLRLVVEASVAKSGSGAVLVSACTVADLFADYATLARQLAEAKAEIERLDAECRQHMTQALNNGQAALQAESQLTEATRRLGEVEGVAARLLTFSSAEYVPNVLFDQLRAALTKEPTK